MVDPLRYMWILEDLFGRQRKVEFCLTGRQRISLTHLRCRHGDGCHKCYHTCSGIDLSHAASALGCARRICICAQLNTAARVGITDYFEDALPIWLHRPVKTCPPKEDIAR